MQGAVPGVQCVCEDVQTADHSGGVTSCKHTPESAENHQINEHHRDTETQRERHGDLTKQRDPVSNQSGQLTEQTRAEQQEVKETARGRRNGSLNR